MPKEIIPEQGIQREHGTQQAASTRAGCSKLLITASDGKPQLQPIPCPITLMGKNLFLISHVAG